MHQYCNVRDVDNVYNLNLNTADLSRHSGFLVLLDICLTLTVYKTSLNTLLTLPRTILDITTFTNTSSNWTYFMRPLAVQPTLKPR